MLLSPTLRVDKAEGPRHCQCRIPTDTHAMSAVKAASAGLSRLFVFSLNRLGCASSLLLTVVLWALLLLLIGRLQ